MSIRIERLPGNPIIRPDMDGRMGSNINGPSLIRVPDWLQSPLGAYYLYFAAHGGKYIRLAYADHLLGPWRTYEPGTLRLEDSYFVRHIASPDIHVDDERREILMYCHGPDEAAKSQKTRLAVSQDGIRFTVGPEILGSSYFRVFKWEDYFYALEMPGRLRRSRDGRSGFEKGPHLFTDDMRHSALKLDGDVLTVFYSVKRQCPEHILCAKIRLTADWMDWKAGEPCSVVKPETDYEGADCPLVPSEGGKVLERVRQLRDPCIYREGAETYLLYSVAGEHGIAIAMLIDDQ